MAKPRLLFLCTGNSCRSQMAEAWAKNMLPEEVEVLSAGVVSHGMNPNVEQVMQEVGLSTQHQYSKTLEELGAQHFDIVVTVCDNAAESCPTWPEQTTHIHQPFPDPPKLAQRTQNEEEQLNAYRTVRDQIKCWIAGPLTAELSTL